MRLPTALLGAALCLALTSCAPSPHLSKAEFAEIMDLRQADLDRLATMYGLDPNRPIPDLIQWSNPNDFEGLLTTCFEDLGIDTNVDAGQGNGFSGEVTVSEQDIQSLFAADWECRAKYSPDPRMMKPFTKVQLSTLYHYVDAELRECLSKHGFLVRPAPTLDSFIADADRKLWSPYDRVHQEDMDSESWSKLRTDCPPYPPPAELYGPPLPQP